MTTTTENPTTTAVDLSDPQNWTHENLPLGTEVCVRYRGTWYAPSPITEYTDVNGDSIPTTSHYNLSPDLGVDAIAIPTPLSEFSVGDLVRRVRSQMSRTEEPWVIRSINGGQVGISAPDQPNDVALAMHWTLEKVPTSPDPIAVGDLVWWADGIGANGGQVTQIDGDQASIGHHQQHSLSELTKVETIAVGDRVRVARDAQDAAGMVLTVGRVSDRGAPRGPMVYFTDERQGGRFMWRLDKVTDEEAAERIRVGDSVWYAVSDSIDGARGGRVQSVGNGVLTLNGGHRTVLVSEATKVGLQVGDRVRLVRSASSQAGAEGVITRIVEEPENSLVHTDNLDTDGFFMWRYDKVEDAPEATPDDGGPEPEEEFTVGEQVMYYTGSYWDRGTIERIDGDVFHMAYGYQIQRENVGKIHTFAVGDRVKYTRLPRDHEHYGRVGIVSAVSGRDIDVRFDNMDEAEWNPSGTPPTGFYAAWSFEPEPLTEQEQERKSLEDEYLALSNAAAVFGRKVRTTAHQMKVDHGYCGVLEQFLRDADLSPNPIYSTRLNLTVDVEIDTAGHREDDMATYSRQELVTRALRWALAHDGLTLTLPPGDRDGGSLGTVTLRTAVQGGADEVTVGLASPDPAAAPESSTS